jgi:hypothetical protein
MTNNVAELIAWLKTNPGLEAANADYFRGQVADTAANSARRLISVLPTGGGQTGVELDASSIRLMVFGARDNPAGQMAAIEDALKDVCKRLKTDYKTCGIAQIAVIGGIIGPGRTLENRPWYELNLQILT